MTYVEFMNAVITGITNDEVTEYAKNALAKHQADLEKRRNTPTKAQKENEPLYAKILDEVITDEYQTASDVAAALDVKVQKASALLRALVTAGKIEATDMKMPKKGTVKAYRAIQGE